MIGATLTTGEVAARLDVTPQTVINWIKRGRLRATVTGGGHRRIPIEDVEALALSLPNYVPSPTAGDDAG